MEQKQVLSSALVAIILVQLVTPASCDTAPVRDALLGMINMVDATAKASLEAINTGIQGLINAVRGMLNTATSIKSTALQTGVDFVKQGADIGTSLAGILNLPGVEIIATAGSKAAKTGADVVNLAGQTVITMGEVAANRTAAVATNISQAGTDALTGGVSAISAFATQGVNSLLDLVDGVNKTVAVVDEEIDAISAWATFIADLERERKKRSTG